MLKNIENPIDFVLTWVDGADPAWKAEKTSLQEKNHHRFIDLIIRIGDYSLLV